jgi:ribosomal protein L30E
VQVILKAEKEKRAVFGTDMALKLLKKGDASEVFLSSSCSVETEQKLNSLAKLSGAKVVRLDVDSAELAAQLKKNFNMSVVSIRKPKER